MNIIFYKYTIYKYIISHGLGNPQKKKKMPLI